MKDEEKMLTPCLRGEGHDGYLTLNEEQISRLITREPIDNFYSVDQQPFARGKYACVKRCKDLKTGQEYAAKFLKKRKKSMDARPEILHEIAVLDACNSNCHIVKLHKVFETTSDIILLLELAIGGELQAVLDQDEVLSECQVRYLMKQILQGLVFLHSINVAHLDIKPQNLVLSKKMPACEVKLCDFGISRYLGQDADVREILGTPDYVAPEILNYEPISLSTDMWSLGVLMYVLLSGCSPFGGDTKQETFCNISQCELEFPEDIFEGVTESAKQLITQLIVKDPRKRLSADQCLKHTWFNQENEILVISDDPIPPETDLSEIEMKSTLPIGEQPNEEISTAKDQGQEDQGREDHGQEDDHSWPKELLDVTKIGYGDWSYGSGGTLTRATSLQSITGDNNNRKSNFLSIERRMECANIEPFLRYRKIYVLDDTDASSSPTTSSNSDSSSVDSSIIDSAESSSSRSSILSLDDSYDYVYGFDRIYKFNNCNSRKFSDNNSVYHLYEKARCVGSFTKAVAQLASSAETLYCENVTSPDCPPPFIYADPKSRVKAKARCVGLELSNEKRGNFVIIKETTKVNGNRYARCSKLECESLQSRIKKLGIPNEHNVRH